MPLLTAGTGANRALQRVPAAETRIAVRIEGSSYAELGHGEFAVRQVHRPLAVGAMPAASPGHLAGNEAPEVPLRRSAPG
jgi:hypothetical protein